MLVELNLVEQRYATVLEVLNEGGIGRQEGALEVQPERDGDRGRGPGGVTRQTVQRWLRRPARRPGRVHRRRRTSPGGADGDASGGDDGQDQFCRDPLWGRVVAVRRDRGGVGRRRDRVDQSPGRVGPDPCAAAPAGQGARRAATQTKAAGVPAAAADRVTVSR